jgi:glyoxylase-like metal-dependent hydrolase (beta-lactamase superfamily II)
MIEVVPGVWRWHEHSERLGYNLNGWYWANEGVAVAVDPPTLTDAARERMEADGKPGLIVVTNRTHWRQTEALREWSGAEVAMSVVDGAAVDGEVERVLAGGEEVPGGWRVLEMPGKTLGEIGLYHNDGVVIVGDSLIGDPPGRLRLLPSDKIEDRGLLLASLTALSALRFDTLLVGDGEPIVGEADVRVRDLLLKLI